MSLYKKDNYLSLFYAYIQYGISLMLLGVRGIFEAHHPEEETIFLKEPSLKPHQHLFEKAYTAPKDSLHQTSLQKYHIQHFIHAYK
jgi:hypothetical protein